MAIHKLKDGPVTIRVASVEHTEGNYGPQIKFVGEDGDIVFVNASTAEQQLGRAGLDAASAVGKTLHMEQVQKNGRTFTNIGVLKGGGAASIAGGGYVQATRQAPAPNIGNLPGWPADEQEQAEQQFVEQVKAQEDRGSVAFRELCRLHTACLDYVLDHEVRLMNTFDVPVTDQGVSALAAQIFIEANRKGIVLPPVSRAA